MNKTPSGMFATTVYLTDKLVAAIEKKKKLLEGMHPGIRVSLSDIMRNYIEMGIGAEENATRLVRR